MTLPRFSLRLLLLAVAVLCAWLAWERSVVMQRRTMLQKWAGESQTRVVTAEDWVEILRPFPIRAEPPSVSWVRQLMGDTAILMIRLDHTASADEVERAKLLFPGRVVQAGPAPLPAPRFSR